MNKYKATCIYSILHFFIDGICALAMFGWFTKQEQGYFHFLTYNFCAFALQMPLGALLDLQIMKQKETMRSYVFATLGVILTITGAFTHPIVLGIGNALFHVGGGVGVIYEDHANHWRGKALGIFVAPGAMGLFLGTQIAKQSTANMQMISLCLTSVFVIGLLVMLKYKYPVKAVKETSISYAGKKSSILVIGCFLVVILRSYVGMAVTFSWKNSFLISFVCILAVVLGKMAGGLFSAKWGMKRVIGISLLLSVLGYFFSGNAVLGVLALFTFNMSMPITLYLLVCKWRELPGFSFGLLTFGLFLGFLPSYLQLSVPFDGNIVGGIGSLLSLALLWIAMRFGGASHVDRPD